MKPGVKTSEFWVALGVLTPDQAEVVEGKLTQIVNSVFNALLIAGPSVVYIWSRAKVKAGK